VIALIDPTEKEIPQDQLEKAVSVIESWMVRRLLVRGTNKAYNKLVVEMVRIVNKDRSNAGTKLEKFFAVQRSNSSYWPDDAEVSSYLSTRQIYRNLYRPRIRMILESVEDYKRGWIGKEDSKSGIRVKRGSYTIEHIMPQKWQAHWPLGNQTEVEREADIQTIGNLTLLTTKLNASVSNGPWNAKSDELTKHDVLLINKQVQKLGEKGWSEELIKARTSSLIQTMTEIWPVPTGHKSVVVADGNERQVKVEVLDLISAGLVAAGQTLYPRRTGANGQLAQILEDGRISVAGEVFDSLSMAAVKVMNKNQNGWYFWLVDEKTKESMIDLRKQYREMIGDEDEDDEADDDSDR
jgi:hypothetical protein